MTLVAEDFRWRRFAIGARNMQEIVAARIANPPQLFLIITNHNS